MPFRRQKDEQHLYDESIDQKDKKAFILEIDNVNDVEMLENMAKDPIIKTGMKKMKTDMLLINTHMNIISEDHLQDQKEKKKKHLLM